MLLSCKKSPCGRWFVDVTHSVTEISQENSIKAKEVLEKKNDRILPMAISPDREYFLYSQNLHLIEDNHYGRRMIYVCL